eukprot:s2711_g5.t1
MFYVEPDGLWSFWVGTGKSWAKLYGSTAVLGKWTHLRGTVDVQSKEARLYVDRQLVARGWASYVHNTRQPLRLGAGKSEAEAHFFFTGDLRDARALGDFQVLVIGRLVTNEDFSDEMLKLAKVAGPQGAHLLEQLPKLLSASVESRPPKRLGSFGFGPAMGDGADALDGGHAVMTEKIDTTETIWVGMRLRPLVEREKGQPHCLRIEGPEVHVVEEALDSERRMELHRAYFAFDVAMDSTDPSKPEYISQEKCYEIMGGRMVQHMLQGFNTCLFCYGQTGTGKTTTIMGSVRPLRQRTGWAKGLRLISWGSVKAFEGAFMVLDCLVFSTFRVPLGMKTTFKTNTFD